MYLYNINNSSAYFSVLETLSESVTFLKRYSMLRSIETRIRVMFNNSSVYLALLRHFVKVRYFFKFNISWQFLNFLSMKYLFYFMLVSLYFIFIFIHPSYHQLRPPFQQTVTNELHPDFVMIHRNCIKSCIHSKLPSICT